LAIGSHRGNISVNREKGFFLLPDPLVLPDGTSIGDATDWQTRAVPVWRAFCESQIYGPAPPATPVRATVVATAAARTTIDIIFAATLAPIRVALYRPATPARALFLGPNFAGNASLDASLEIDDRWMRPEPAWGIVANRATQATRGVHADRLPIASILARGYAIATWYDGDVCPDDPALCAARGRSLGVAASAIALWAWGFSLVLDGLKQTGLVANEKAVAFGHSRHGKAALWASANDARFAGTIANNSGAGGARPFRCHGGETIADLFQRFPHWFSPTLKNFAGREAELAVDQHIVLALTAPRPLYIASASEDAWANPLGERAGLDAAAAVFDLFGTRAALGYHRRAGGHAITPADWAQFLDFFDRC
jgi:hypothetical protein